MAVDAVSKSNLPISAIPTVDPTISIKEISIKIDLADLFKEAPFLSNFVASFFDSSTGFDALSDDQLVEKYGLTNLKLMSAWGTLPSERYEAVLAAAKESFRSKNGSLSFSEWLDKEPLHRLLDFYTFEEVKAKFDEQFKDATVYQIMQKAGPRIFMTAEGRRLADYSRFQTLETVKLDEVLEIQGGKLYLRSRSILIQIGCL